MGGVRLDQRFGKLVSWDRLPRIAFACMEVMPGSNARPSSRPVRHAAPGVACACGSDRIGATLHDMGPDAIPLVDPSRCPLCGEDNTCGAQRGASSCWCVTTVIPAEVLARIPAHLQDRACVCAKCATQSRLDSDATGSP